MVNPPTGRELARRVRGVYAKLLEEDIVTSDGYSAVWKACSFLARAGDQCAWYTSVDHEEPIIFSESRIHCVDKKPVQPRITAKELRISNLGKKYVFASWNIALEVWHSDREATSPICRWHMDLANPGQSGPVLHLQYGGNSPFRGYVPPPISVPRWHYPHLDLILMGEIVAANFFEDRWKVFREDPTWCGHISFAEEYCLGVYQKHLQAGQATSRTTVLNEFWQD